MTTTLPVLVPELVGAAFTGKVVKSFPTYCFIGDVKQGYATVPTNGDVFCPVPLAEGSMVEFDNMDEDRERPGKFRTEGARILSTVEFGVVTTDRTETQIARAEKILALSEVRSAYHSRAKKVSGDEARKAAENGPFAAMAYMAEAAAARAFDLVEAVGSFLRNQFATLGDMGFACSITDEIDEEGERRRMDEAKQAYASEGLEGQTESLQREYEELRGIRNVFRMLHTNNALSAETIVPIHYLPDMLVTAPVWYVWSQNTVDQDGMDDPHPDDATQFFCNRVGSKEFAWLYQIYNRRTRPISRFAGREIGGKFVSDTMPPRIVKMIGEAKKVFDFVVIATPYHDIASREWNDPNWLRNIDPFLFGFFKRLDFMFMLGRWSGTGLFPQTCEMIADTMSHLAMNKQALANFPANAYWHMGGLKECLVNSSQSGGNNVLVPFAGKVLEAYNEDRLFAFLRGELKTEKA